MKPRWWDFTSIRYRRINAIMTAMTRFYRLNNDRHMLTARSAISGMTRDRPGLVLLPPDQTLSLFAIVSRPSYRYMDWGVP